MDYYCATKLITTQQCKQVYMSWPVVLASQKLHTTAEPQYFRENHNANSRKNHSAKLGKTTVAK